MLAACDARTGWPRRGVYFFFEPGQARDDGTPRVVRVGTHAVSRGSKATLWGRLKQHRGDGRAGVAGGGSHRGSIFRRHVGEALIRAGRLAPIASWGIGASATAEVRAAEHDHERAVSATIGAMPFVWIEADDEPSAQSVRAVIERNVIGLLAAGHPAGIDAPSAGWLGHSAAADEIRNGGLWNVRFVEPTYDASVLELLDQYARTTSPR